MCHKITDTKIETVKQYIGKYELKEISRKVGIAYSTVVKINLGHYDSGKFVNPTVKAPEPEFFNVDKQSWIV